MKWIEVIELRSVASNRKLLESILQKLIEEVNKETKRPAIKAYSRSVLDTDFKIHLFHNSDKVKESGSRLGLRLASALKTFGLVSHCTWVEMPGG
jgi:hypothetical protein